MQNIKKKPTKGKRLPANVKGGVKSKIIVSNRIGQAIIDVASEKECDIKIIKTKILEEIPEMGKFLFGRIISNNSQPSFRQAYLIAKAIGKSVDDLYQVK